MSLIIDKSGKSCTYRPAIHGTVHAADDLTFIIPMRVDSEDRIHNGLVVLGYIQKNFPQSEIVLVESDQVVRTELFTKAFPNVKRLFDYNPGRFSRGLVINLGMALATRAFVCVYDADVLLCPEAIFRALSLLRSRVKRIVIPHNQIFIDVSGELRTVLSQDPDLDRFGRFQTLAQIPVRQDLQIRIVSGGVMLGDKEVLLLEGGFNKKMVSYGWEDTEFFKRFDKLGYYSFMLPDFNLIHLDHRRGADSQINEMYNHNRLEYEKIAAMSRAELRAYVETDLDIAQPGEGTRRIILRRRQALMNGLTGQWITHLLNKIRIYVQIYGIVNLLRRVLYGEKIHLQGLS